MEVIQQPVLHIEARVKNTGDGMIVRTDLVRAYAPGRWRLELMKVRSGTILRSGSSTTSWSFHWDKRSIRLVIPALAH